MTLEELKDLRELMILKIELGETASSIPTRVISLIDAEIARQSVTDEDVQRAKNWIEEYYEFWRSLSTQPELEVFETILAALQQMRTEKCELIPDRDVDDNGIWTCSKCGNKFLFDNDPREYVKFCWNCGRKVS